MVLAVRPCRTSGQKYYLEVVDVKPQDAACIIEADVNVDFDAPVGYKEPERVPVAPPKPVLPEVQKAKEVVAEAERPKFKAFTGTGGRIDGKALKPAQLSAAEEGDGGGTVAIAGECANPSGHNWGEGTGSIKAGNTAAERRAAALKAAEARAASSSSMSSSLSPLAAPAAPSPAGGVGGATKWSKSAKLGHFQAGTGNRLN